MTDPKNSAGTPAGNVFASGGPGAPAPGGRVTPGTGGKLPVPPRKRHRFRNFMLLLLLIAGLGSAIWSWATVNISYSSGEKTGFVQNLSKQGWLCKTWEGELAVEPAPGAAPEVFAFTIRNDSIASALQQVLPARVALTYELHRGVPSSCFGETSYYISGFRTTD